MDLIGLIGGLSWESSAAYYRIINQTVQRELGGVHSARTLMYSFEFEEMKRLQHQGEWAVAARMMSDAARRLERGGADFFLICCNTMHKVADEIAASVGLPLLHIADPTGEKIKAAGFARVGLLGTAFTMEQEFYKGRLEQKFGLEVVVPKRDQRRVVHGVIYEELVRGIVQDSSREQYKSIIRGLIDDGAEAIVLGCTEIMLLIGANDSPAPVFDTTTLHAEAAALRALHAEAACVL